MEEKDLIEKLRKIEWLYARATTSGERLAAENARERIRERLRITQQQAEAIEIRFSLPDHWSRRLLLSLLRRYGLEPYRYAGQRQTTVMVRAPRIFVDETLWPEFQELNRTLRAYLDEVTDRLIQKEIHRDSSEAQVQRGTPVRPERLSAGVS
jgi:hypothetical protein